MAAPMVLDGPMDGPAFEAYVTQVLLPTLGPSDIVVMDNLAAHKRAEVGIAINAAGARLLYPDRRSWTSSCSFRCDAVVRLNQSTWLPFAR